METQPQRPIINKNTQSKSLQQARSQLNNQIQNTQQTPPQQLNRQFTNVQEQPNISNNQSSMYPQKNNTINSQKPNNILGDHKITYEISEAIQQKTNKSNLKQSTVKNNKYKSFKTAYNYQNYNVNNGNGNGKKVHRLNTDNPHPGNYVHIYGFSSNHNSKNKTNKLAIQRNSNNVSSSFSRNKIQNDTNQYLLVKKHSKDQLHILHSSVLSNPKSQMYNKNHPPLLTKQQLYEQNNHLKNIINQLKDTLSRQKIQTQMQKKKNKKYTTILKRQFKKEFYYASNSNGNSVNKSVQYGPYIDCGDAQQERNNINQNINKIANIYNNSQKNSDKNQDSSDNSPQKIRLYTDQSQNPTSMYHKNYKHYKILTKHQSLQQSNISDQAIVNRSNQYMVAGIKQKYEQLRTVHQKVLAELNAVKGTDQMKKLEEIGIYCRTLEESNRKLGVGLQIAQNKLNAYEQKFALRDQSIYNSAVIAQKNQKIQSLKAKNSSLKNQNRKLKNQQKQNIKLVDYLQKLIISKDNLYAKSLTTAKKLNKLLQKLEIELQNQCKENSTMKSSYIKQLEQLHQNYQNKIEQSNKMFEQAIAQRNSQIKRLEKQVNYLSTILEHWKPKDQQVSNKPNKKKRKQSNVSINHSIISKQGKNQLQKVQKSSQGVNSANPIAKIIQRRQLQRDYETKVTMVAASLTNRNTKIEQPEMMKSSSKKVQKLFPLNSQRKRKTAAIRNSDSSKKTRRISFQNLAQLPEFLRLRLIGLDIPIDQACKYLDYRPLLMRQDQEQPIRNSTYSILASQELSDQQKWKKKYINLLQLKAILVQQPFKLKPEDAQTLSRYIVEDQCFYQNGDITNGFVFFDLQNQIQRALAKSILKAFIQSHSPTNLNKSSRQVNKYQNFQNIWLEIIQKNGVRLNNSLLSIAPSGVISSFKWNQLLNSINVEVSDDMKEWCIGKMLIQSDTLSKLKFRAIVPDID